MNSLFNLLTRCRIVLLSYRKNKTKNLLQELKELPPLGLNKSTFLYGSTSL